jgi:hypothetical protein
LSNIVFTGALALYKTHHYDPLYRFYLTLAAIIASTVYHLSEVKSRLPGLPWLRKYASILIQFDRIFAITLMLDVGYAIWPNFWTQPSFWVGLIGIFFGLASEYHIWWSFVCYHSVWHNAAFLAVYLL